MIVPLAKMLHQRRHPRYVKLYYRSPSIKVMRRERLAKSPEVVPFKQDDADVEKRYWDIWTYRRFRSIWP